MHEEMVKAAMALGRRIKIERVRLGLTQAEVAARCMVGRNTWSRYETGKIAISAASLMAFVGMGADADFLATGHPQAEFSDPPAFYGPAPDANRAALLRYWGALPPELQAKILDLAETMAHLYLHFDKGR